MTAFADWTAAQRASRAAICHLQPYDPVGVAIVDLYYSTHGFTSEPGDTPANKYYDARLKTGYQANWSLFSQGKLSGPSAPAAIVIRLINNDGGLDALKDYAWAGRRARVWMGAAEFALSDYGLAVDGIVDSFEAARDEFVVHLRDVRYLLDREIQSNSFAGSGGAEGGDDVKNRRKPLVYGVARNVRCIYIGAVAGLHTFSVADGAIVGVIRVRDLGLDLTFNAATPGAGEWTCNVAAGTITLGGAYNGPITADIIGLRYLSATSSTSWTVATGSKTFTVSAGLAIAVGMKLRVARTAALASTWGDGAVTAYSGTSLTVNVTSISGTAGPFTDWTISPWGTAAGIMNAIAVRMGVASFDTASLAALDAAQPATVGWWIEEGGNALQQIDAIANGVSGFHYFNRSGQFSVGRLTAPTSPAASYGELEILENSLRGLQIDEPNYRIDVRWGRNWAGDMSANELAGAVSDADRALLSHEWRTATDDDSAVLTTYPNSQPVVVDSIFDESSAAAAEATRLLALYGVRRDAFEIRLKLQPLARSLVDTVTLLDETKNRYGLAAGKDVRIVGLDENMTPTVCEVTAQLWG